MLKDIRIKESKVEQRSSNIELFRIVLMIMIIMHHYVVNSGLDLPKDINFSVASNEMIKNSIIAQMLGWGGKCGIDGFVLITGYYMCQKNISLKKFFKLLTEVFFYNVVINGIFLLLGYYPLEKADLIKNMFSLGLLTGLGPGSDSFTAHYLLLYILIPFINATINSINQNMHKKLIIILAVIYSIIPTVTQLIINTFSGLGCYIWVYLIGAYLSKYHVKIDTFKCGLYGTVASIIVVAFSNLGSDIIKILFDVGGGIPLANGMGMIMSIVTAVFMFILFKNIKMEYNRIVNLFASTTLGVLCIHANSDTMRYFLWQELLQVRKSQEGNVVIFLVRLIIIPIIVFLVCALVDILRQKFFDLIIGYKQSSRAV